VGRSCNWRKKGNSELSTTALYRALELIDFTLDDPKHINILSELTPMREILLDDFPFNIAARMNK
jgi:hypothetical protein